jgi:hypothetical protein
MHTEKLTEFSGVAGRVLQRSVSGGSMLSGMVLGFLLIAGNFVLIMAGTPKLAAPFTQIVIALALARFAVNGLYGEWGGSIFSTAGGSWATVGQVSLRYLALTCLWLLPMMIIEAISTNAAQSSAQMDPMMMNPEMNPMMMMMGSGVLRALLGFAAFYLLAATLTPPLFLAASVSADGFGDIFTPQHWKDLFGGRLGDLFSVYVIYAGALVMVLLVCLPVAMLAFALNSKLGFLATATSACLLFGVSVSLLGRLCGFFACGDLGINDPTDKPRLKPAPATGPRPAPQAGPSPAPVERPTSVPLASPDPSIPGTPASAPVADPSATQAIPASVAKQALAGASAQGQVLADAKQKVEAAMNRFATDPAGAIASLEQLDRSFAAHPLVQQALAICLFRSGETDRAVTVGKTAIPFCMERGHVNIAAQILRELKARLGDLGLNREQLLALAGSLVHQEDWAAAAKTYTAVLHVDSLDTAAIKGMLQVGEGILNKKRNPAAAVKIYRFLARHCADSPLSEYIQHGLAEAEQRGGALVEAASR